MQRRMSALLAMITLSFGLAGCSNPDEAAQPITPSSNGIIQTPQTSNTISSVRPANLPSNCDPIFQRLLCAMNKPVKAEECKWEYVHVNLTDPSGQTDSADMYLPLKDGRFYTPLEWLGVVGIDASWNQNRNLLKLLNADKTQCLMIPAEEPTAPAGAHAPVVLAIASNRYQLNLWLKAQAHGINPLVGSPDVKLIYVQSTALSEPGDPMLTLRAVCAVLGADDQNITLTWPEGEISDTNPGQIDIQIACSIQDVKTKKHAVRDWPDAECPTMGLGVR